MIAAFPRLAVALQAVAELAQELGDDVWADVVAHILQGDRKLLEALRGPQQRRHRIAARGRFEQILEILEQCRILLGLGFATATGPAYSTLACRAPLLDLIDAAIDRGSRNAGHFRHQRDAAVPQCERLGGRKTPPPLLVEHRFQCLEALPNQLRGVRHRQLLRHAIPTRESPRSSF
jgi:hypothetical protein